MTAFPLAGSIFVTTLGGIWLGALLRGVLPKHHLNDSAKEVVRDCVRLIATIVALVLGLLIGASRASFDTQSTQVNQITANLILLDSLLAQYGADALPIRQHMRRAVGPFADRLWREKQVTSIGPFQANRGYPEALRADGRPKVTAITGRASQQRHCAGPVPAFHRERKSDPDPFFGNFGFLASDCIRQLQPILASEYDPLHLLVVIRLLGGVRHLPRSRIKSPLQWNNDAFKRPSPECVGCDLILPPRAL
jgi:hypothetical protein